MGRRNSKGSVSIDQDKINIRLRWRYQFKRSSLNLFLYNRSNLLRAKKIALAIEDDMAMNAFDESLNQYKALITQLSQQHSSKENLSQTPIEITPPKEISRGKKQNLKKYLLLIVTNSPIRTHS